ncbi:hypothetical protein IWQ60_006621 [Tieghemiomyces parasiticus]|uniref:Aminotransferase class I/classII large domain-containing protein n=1 Tax=Tieghemiomyces parasiticus TaxID=78921 RepID=A0A9W8ACD7_9FUNG|nr:hypothetical protein IWQ60_006621 [Tieghemiomyces parasiticus]
MTVTHNLNDVAEAATVPHLVDKAGIVKSKVTHPPRSALDLLPLLGDAKRRSRTPIKQLYQYFFMPGMLSLSAGLPHPSSFAFRSLSATVPSMEAANVNGVPSPAPELQVTIPFHPAPGSGPLQASVALCNSLQYGTAQGILGLQAFLREHVEEIHHPPYADWDVITTVGSTDALDKAVSLIGTAGDYLLVDEWTYPAAIDTATSNGLHTTPIPMDQDGMIPEALEQTLSTWPADRPRPKLLYLVPTGQNPTGATLPLSRRRAIYALAQSYNLIIIEDDPYYYLQFAPYQPAAERTNDSMDAQPGLSGLLPSFLSLDTDGRVLRLDSFSKILAPGSRCGWITTSKQFLPYLEYHNETTIQQPSGFSQAIITELLTNTWKHAGWSMYLKRLQYDYYQRRNLFIDQLAKHLNGLVDYAVPPAGMFCWIKLRLPSSLTGSRGADRDVMGDILEALVAERVIAIPGHYFAGQIDRAAMAQEPYFRTAFAHASPEDFGPALERMARALQRFNLGDD